MLRFASLIAHRHVEDERIAVFDHARVNGGHSSASTSFAICSGVSVGA